MKSQRLAYPLYIAASLVILNIVGVAAQDPDFEAVSSSTGDPIFNTFDGQMFEFHGNVGRFYNLFAVPGEFMLSTRLKLGVMYDHNGTYMDAIGVQRHEAQVKVEIDDNTAPHLRVTCNGQELALDVVEKSVEKLMYLKDGSHVIVRFRTHVPLLGTIVEVQTELADVLVTLVSPHMDPGGVMQPFYLNTNITVKDLPAKDAQGIMGESLNYVRQRIEAKESGAPKVPRPNFPLMDDTGYELPDLFALASLPEHHVVAVQRRLLGRGAEKRNARKLRGNFGGALGELDSVARFPFSARVYQ